MTDTTKLTDGSLIAAEKVNGTDVYNTQGDKLGEVEDIMLDKISGQVAYAVLSFGGFLGLGEKHYPLPWSTLKYDTRKGGYVVNIDKELLENAPSIDRDDEDFAWTADYGRGIDRYYGIPTMWM
jgi:sporulation protein YlmC with PRC-barrel domain